MDLMITLVEILPLYSTIICIYIYIHVHTYNKTVFLSIDISLYQRQCSISYFIVDFHTNPNLIENLI